MTLILATGALISLDRDERAMWTRLKGALAAAQPPVTHAGVLAQAWRGGPRHARLARALHGIDVQPLDEPLGRASGELLAAAGLSDVIDAALVLLSDDGDDIITSDAADIGLLARTSGRHVELVRP